MPTDIRHRELLEFLTASGALDDMWRATFEAVPRHEFLPDTVWQLDRHTDGRLVPLCRVDDPERWLELAYHDIAIETQVDDGHPAPDGTGWEVTSSSSQPTVVVQMLRALDVEPGMRVLEIGAGTGWNAALLAHRLGAENVVTVEIDPAVAAHARAALDRAGYHKVTTIVGDGTPGWPDGGPYDRVIATVGVREIPYPWVVQTVPGGRLVVPMVNTYQPPGIVTFTTSDTTSGGPTAVGRIGERAAFMALRSQRHPRLGGGPVRVPEVTSTTELHPSRWAGDRAAATAVGQRVAGIDRHYEPETDRTGTMWLRDPATESWAWVEVAPRPPYTVAQAGPRRLFDEVAVAYQWWLDAGSPPLDAWQFVVDVHGQRLDLA